MQQHGGDNERNCTHVNLQRSTPFPINTVPRLQKLQHRGLRWERCWGHVTLIPSNSNAHGAHIEMDILAYHPRISHKPCVCSTVRKKGALVVRRPVLPHCRARRSFLCTKKASGKFASKASSLTTVKSISLIGCQAFHRIMATSLHNVEWE